MQDQRISQKIKKELGDSVNLVFLNLSLSNTTFSHANYTGPIFKPFSWVKISGRQGAKLLLLFSEFDLLPVRLLSYELETIHVPIKEIPEYCFRGLNVSEVETILRESVFNNFQNIHVSIEQPVDLKPGDAVCNLHINNEGGYADFRYICCERNGVGEMSCSFLYEGHSISNAILAIMFCLNTIFKFDLVFLKHKFNSPTARQFNT